MKHLTLICFSALTIGYLIGSIHKIDTREYQIECTNHGMKIYDKKRHVGTIPYDTSKFSLLILNDNQ